MRAIGTCRTCTVMTDFLAGSDTYFAAYWTGNACFISIYKISCLFQNVCMLHTITPYICAFYRTPCTTDGTSIDQRWHLGEARMKRVFATHVPQNGDVSGQEQSWNRHCEVWTQRRSSASPVIAQKVPYMQTYRCHKHHFQSSTGNYRVWGRLAISVSWNHDLVILQARPGPLTVSIPWNQHFLPHTWNTGSISGTYVQKNIQCLRILRTERKFSGRLVVQSYAPT